MHQAAVRRGNDEYAIWAARGHGVAGRLPATRASGPPIQPSARAGRISAQSRALQPLKDPHLAWGFYGHRLKLYRDTQPHAGFAILQRIASQMPHGAFVFTSNVDGQFQKAGFSEMQVCECHCSIHHLQCLSPRCEPQIWPRAGDFSRSSMSTPVGLNPRLRGVAPAAASRGPTS